MSFQYTLQKVMDLREREKIDIQAQYSEAMSHFEKVATHLYELLKRKEEIESRARQQVAAGVSIFELQQSQSQLLRLQQEINQQQRSTQLAREKMNRKQSDLVDISIEFKKYEKMKERKSELYQQEQVRLESQEMDELSVQLFAKR